MQQGPDLTPTREVTTCSDLPCGGQVRPLLHLISRFIVPPAVWLTRAELVHHRCCKNVHSLDSYVHRARDVVRQRKQWTLLMGAALVNRKDQQAAEQSGCVNS